MLVCKTGLTAPDGFLQQVYAIDKMVYPPSLWGVLHNLEIRYERCPDSYILVYHRKVLVGYLCFLPIGEKLYDQLNDPNDTTMRDDDITPEEMEPWRKDALNHLFILSVAIQPAYQGGQVIRLLGDGFLSFLREKAAAGYPIGSVAGSAVSAGGENFLKRLHGVFIKELDDGYRYYMANRKAIKELLQNGLLLKDLRK